MKFVLHSHDKMDRLSHLENDRFVHHLENNMHAPCAPDYTVCVFILERSSFSVYIIPEWNVIPEWEFHSDWKPECTHSWMTCVGPNFCLRYHVNRYRRNILGWEWTRSGMKVIPVSCERPLDTRMSFIPEWVSFQNEVSTAFTWQNWPAQLSWKRPFLSSILKTIHMRHSPQTTRFAFSSRNGVRFQFTWYQNEISYQNESFIWIVIPVSCKWPLSWSYYYGQS